jgi:NAD(P)-dependent dehydrogenase (short-subunit alcohol dehydrogenase family)
VAQSVLLCAIGVAEALAPALDAAGATIRVATSAQDAVDAVRAEAPEVIAIALANPAGATHRAVRDWGLADWMAAADQPILDLLRLLQALRSEIGGRETVIVLIGPDLGQTGAAGLVALSAATEGQRGLMKTLARQWGPAIRFVWAGVWPPLLFPEIDPAILPQQPELGPYTPPLRERPGWDQVATTVLALAALGRAATGQSVIVDGGEWMLP